MPIWKVSASKYLGNNFFPLSGNEFEILQKHENIYVKRLALFLYDAGSHNQSTLSKKLTPLPSFPCRKAHALTAHTSSMLTNTLNHDPESTYQLLYNSPMRAKPK